MRSCFLAVVFALMIATPASAATVTGTGSSVGFTATAGEANDLTVAQVTLGGRSLLAFFDNGSELTASGSCGLNELDGVVTCPLSSIRSLTVDLSDGNDHADLSDAGIAAAVIGGEGNDVITGTALADRLDGSAGDDQLYGGPGRDLLTGGAGLDRLDGGAGSDALLVLDGERDQAACGGDKDRVQADVTDALDRSCETVDHGNQGRLGKVRAIAGRPRLTRVPGQATRVDRRILPALTYLMRRYHVSVGPVRVTKRRTGKRAHPSGLAVDVYPGPGGTWDDVDRLAKWAEPRQNHPRAPFRWVGYNGDVGQGHGKRLRLTWSYGRAHKGRTSTVWSWSVTGAGSAFAPSGG